MNQEIISDVILFIAVIETGSFIAAAKKFGISKPSVSRRINNLEKAIKTKLIKRTTRKLSLTEPGQILYDRCRDFNSTLHDAIAEMLNLKDHPTGKLKIAFSSYFPNDYEALRIIADFMEIYPGISIELHAFTTSADIDLIKKDFDLYFTDTDMTDSHLNSLLLHEYPIKICATPIYFQKNRIPKKPDDLKQHNCLLHFLYEKPVNEWVFKINTVFQTIKVDGSLYASRAQMLLQMVLTGAGIAQLPLFMIEPYLKTGELMTALDEFPLKNSPVYITTYRQKETSKKRRFFTNYMKTQYGK